MAEVVTVTGKNIRRLLKLPTIPLVEVWRQRGLDELVPPTETSIPSTTELLMIRTSLGDEIVWFGCEASHAEVEGHRAVLVDLAGARECADFVVAAATAAAIAQLMNSDVYDMEGCFKGPIQESAGAFLERLALKNEYSDYFEAARAFCAINALV